MRNIRHCLAYRINREVIYAYRNILYIIYTCTQRIIFFIMDYFYEKRLGIETLGSYPLTNDLSLFRDSKGCTPTPYLKLVKIIRYLKLTSDDVFVDLGCGEGRVILFVAAQKIKKAIGVELYKEIADIAQMNLSKSRLKNTPVEIINTDVVNFQPKEGTAFFMFNPFGEKTLEKVLKNIKDTLITNPRRIRIIYYSPAHRNLLDNQEWLLREGEIDSEIFVWHKRVE